ncbi:hypothetical protein BDR07DRAFT_455325 [Suillus spraguei]|nr:hypothetical protein BDR07DRAFT_455325 [Suillus spraguei]
MHSLFLMSTRPCLIYPSKIAKSLTIRSNEIQSVRGHQIRQPGCPRAYVIDGLLVDEDVIDGITNDGFIHVHPCNREDSLCGLWVKADRRSIMRHGQRWHRDARSGGDRSITCPWSGCHRKMRANDIPRHILSAHFGVTWVCRDTECSKVFNRQDSFVAHANKGGCLGAGLGAIVRYDNNDTRLINIHNVLRPSGQGSASLGLWGIIVRFTTSTSDIVLYIIVFLYLHLKPQQ